MLGDFSSLPPVLWGIVLEYLNEFNRTDFMNLLSLLISSNCKIDKVNDLFEINKTALKVSYGKNADLGIGELLPNHFHLDIPFLTEVDISLCLRSLDNQRWKITFNLPLLTTLKVHSSFFFGNEVTVYNTVTDLTIDYSKLGYVKKNSIKLKKVHNNVLDFFPNLVTLKIVGCNQVRKHYLELYGSKIVIV
jgi:hypothetical protein